MRAGRQDGKRRPDREDPVDHGKYIDLLLRVRWEPPEGLGQKNDML